MPLDRDNCREAFKSAMRERLLEDDEALAANVDLPDVEKNLDALGHAVLDILKDNAEVVSSSLPVNPQDFWKWVADVQDYLGAVSVWQGQVQSALTSWNELAPPPVALLELKASLQSIPSPAAFAPAEAPSELKGRIR